MEKKPAINIACLDCWLNKDSVCQFNIQKAEILADVAKTIEEKNRLVAELNDKAWKQKCPYSTPPVKTE